MATVTERLVLLIESVGAGAVSDLKAVGAASEEAAGKQSLLQKNSGVVRGALQGIGIDASKTGDLLKVGLAAGAITGGLALGKFALDGVDKFAQLTGEVRGYQRVTGATAEDSSRLAAAVRLTGTDAQAAQNGFFQLEKRIGSGKDTLANYNIEIARNKDGSVDFSKTLENIAAGFQSIKDPAERAALLQENFGRGGANLIPILSKSKEELQGFYDSAAQHHEIFSQDDLEKGKEFQVSMRELKAAAEGLALEFGQALIPILTTLSDVLKFALEGLDDVGNSLGGIKLSAIPAGAALGALVAKGTELGGAWGAAIGAGVGLVSILGQQKSASEQLDDNTKRLIEDITRLGQAKGLKEFTQASEVRAYADNVSLTTAKLREFRDVAEKDAGAAQQLRDAIAASGGDTTAYDKILQDVTKHAAEHEAATRRQRDAQDQLAGTLQGIPSAAAGYLKSLDDQKKKSDDAKKAAEELKRAQDDLENSLLGLPGAARGYQQALTDEKKAQEDYNQAVADYGPTSAEAQKAEGDLEAAHDRVAQAALELDAAQSTLNTNLKDPAAVQAALDHLTQVQQAYPEAAAALEPYRQKLADTLAYLQAIANQHPNVDVTVNFDANIQPLYDALAFILGHPATQQDLNAFALSLAPAFASGGYTDWPANEGRLAILHGQEAIFNQDQLRALTASMAQAPVMDYAGNFGSTGAQIQLYVPERPENIASFALSAARALRTAQWVAK